MEGIQWVSERAIKTLGKRYAWNLICNYVRRFSSKAVAYRFGENPSVPKIAALLMVCFRYFVLDEKQHTCCGCHCLCSLFTMHRLRGLRV